LPKRNPGLKLANAFGVFTGLKLAIALGVFAGLKLAKPLRRILQFKLNRYHFRELE
jgi:hypothetical protein